MDETKRFSEEPRNHGIPPCMRQNYCVIAPTLGTMFSRLLSSLFHSCCTSDNPVTYRVSGL
uniref:Uncharacterized protein n=1 Tax=Arundo donax TaxID=35708 RepID=A0A0A9PKY0_ARUDO